RLSAGFFGTSDVAGAVFMGGRMINHFWKIKPFLTVLAWNWRQVPHLWCYLIDAAIKFGMREAMAKREPFVRS
ncbi:hypothetical protein, partial [Ancylobacter lacus]|uniref:hypothetical protein n=1 Tax=Ancylobacter lacus TaxID=2579970 RepID=UPI001BCECA9D